MLSNKWYDDNKNEILRLYYNGKTVKEISNTLECNYSMIYRKFNEWDIERRQRVKRPDRYNAKYDIDYQYFDNINDEHKAYWLGMLLADGFVNNKEVSLCLQSSDIESIETFKRDLRSEHPIKYDVYGNPYITIVCKHMCEKLQRYGFNNHKSLQFDMNNILNVISNENEHHFLRGMFDGDGCIKYYKYDYLNKPQFHFGYTGLKNVCEYVASKLNINTKIVFEGNMTYTTRTRNPELIMNIFDYLYKDATIYINRKYNTFEEIKKLITEVYV